MQLNCLCFRQPRMKKERSCSGGTFDFPPTSPGLSRRSHSRSHSNTTAQRLRQLQTQTPLGDITIFHIPGLDVKVAFLLSYPSSNTHILYLLIFRVDILIKHYNTYYFKYYFFKLIFHETT